jgi:MFS family permease
VTSVTHFAIARVLLGIGESPQFTSGVRVVRDWFNVRERAFGIGVVNTSPFIGQAIAPPLLTALMLGFGWRWMFILMGISGLMVAAIWVAFFREPRSLDLEPAERAYLTAGDPPAASKPITFTQ